MAHPKSRHYRVAQKAVEAQVSQREDDRRRDSIFTLMLIIVLITQLFSLAVRIYGLFAGNDTEAC